MIQETLSKIGKENTGHMKHYKPFFDKGGLDFLMQRADIGFVNGDEKYTDKVYIRLGKCDQESKEFKEIVTREGKKEVPQEFRTSNPEIIKEIRIELLKNEIRLRKKQGYFDYEYHRQEEVKDVVRTYKEIMV